jgi:hypothetical protein
LKFLLEQGHLIGINPPGQAKRKNDPYNGTPCDFSGFETVMIILMKKIAPGRFTRGHSIMYHPINR